MKRISFRRCLSSVGVVACLMSATNLAGAQGNPAPPSGGAADDAPRSRLTLTGAYIVEAFAQKNFFLGAGGPVESGLSTDFDAYWTQKLNLQPRLILSDHVNVTVSVNVAQGVWGLESTGSAGTTAAGLYPRSTNLSALSLDWAYLAFRHRGTGSRWYVGQQAFVLGHGLVLDQDAAGIQAYFDLARWNGSLGLGVAKLSESGGLSDQNNTARSDERVGPDGRDADLFFAQWQSGSPVFRVSPFFAYYQDRSNGDGATLYPERLGYANARFQPNVTRATVFGLEVQAMRGPIDFDLEYNQLSGVDRVQNASAGASELLDVNNGDLKGSNLYARIAVQGNRWEIGGILAQGTGDDDPTSGEGNLNRLRTDGNFFITEVWEDSVMPPRGFHPGGLGSPLSRGYRELENTRILQGFLGFKPTPSTHISGSVSLIRSSEDLRPWADTNGDGVIVAEEFGSELSNELGSEFDWRFDWTVDSQVTLSVRGGVFLPRVAAGYLLHGTGEHQEAATEHRLTISVPVPEFSLGG